MAHDFQHDIDAISRIDAVPNILDVVCRITGMGFAAVARVTEDRWIACQVLDKIAFGLVPGDELQVATTICNEIRQSGQAVIIDEVATDEAFCGHPTPALYGFQSYISMPIVRKDGSFFGTLCAIDPAPARLKNPEVIGVFRLFAELIAAQLDAAERLSTSEASLNNERRIAELREQFIAVLGHDLRNPVAALAAGARFLNATPLNDRAKEIVTLMQQSIQRMSGLVDNLLDFARGRLGGGIAVDDPTPTDLLSILTQVIEEHRAVSPLRTINAEIELSHPVAADPGRIAQMFGNLLGNALTHGDPDIPIGVRAVAADGRFELSVSNGGRPIPDEYRADLFKPFSRGKDGQDHRGLGLGLFIASEIARAHKGMLTVSSNADETRFTFSM
jgi:signal transduction histidine kinase